MARKNLKPNWLPVSVWHEYQWQCASAKSSPPDSGAVNSWEQYTQLFEKIVFNKDCSGIWITICGGPDSGASDPQRELLFSQLLIGTLARAINGPPKGLMASKGERKQRWEKIEKQAKDLNKSLAYAAHSTGAPNSVRCKLAERLHQAYQKHTPQDISLHPETRRGMDEMELTKAYMVVDEILFTNGGLLSVLEEAARTYKATKPPSRHQGEDAKAVYVIRELTGFFMSWFEQPHRSHVAALVNSVLGTVISEDYVKDVAPVHLAAPAKRVRRKSPESHTKTKARAKRQ